MKKGINYLVQPQLSLGTNNFKMGNSTKLGLKRLVAYGPNALHLVIAEHDDSASLEKILKAHFKKTFKLIMGTEYFNGKKEKMVEEFKKIVLVEGGRIISCVDAKEMFEK